MGKCEIKLVINNEEHSFNSNEELDGWLFDNRGYLNLIDKDITYSKVFKLSELPADANSAQKNTYGLLTQISTKRNAINLNAELDDQDPKRKVVYTSWSYAQNYVGGWRVETPSRPGGFVNPWSEEELGFRQVFGKQFETAIHNVLFPDRKEKYEVKRGKRTYTISDENKISKLEAIAKQIVEKLKSIHGSDAIFLEQVGVASTNLSGQFKNALRLVSNWKTSNKYKSGYEGIHGGDYTEINTFVGDIDLLVIDRNGVAHIYDFKTSNDFVSVDEDITYARQIGIYSNIVRQGEIEVGTSALIPVRLTINNYDDSVGDQNINKVEWNGNFSDLDNNSRVAKQTRGWFPNGIKPVSQNITKLSEVVAGCFPQSGLDAQIAFRKADIDEQMDTRVFEVKPEHDQYKLGNRYEYKKIGYVQPGESRYIYAESKEKLRPLIEDWVQKYNEEKANTYSVFAKSLRVHMLNGDAEGFNKTAENINPSDTRYLRAVFGRYISPDWNLVSDELMVQNGIFVFQNSDVIELVMLDTHNPYLEFKFPKDKKSTRAYTSILGNFLADGEGVDNRFQLHNYYGNMVMMKGLIFLSQHEEFFKDAKLCRVCEMNINGNRFIEESNEKLVDNFNLLMTEYKNHNPEAKVNLLKIGEHVLSDPTAYVHIAFNILKNIGDNKNGVLNLLDDKTFKDLESRTTYSVDQIKQMIVKLRSLTGQKSYRVEFISWDEDRNKALHYLYQAYLSALGYQISPEERVGLWNNGGVELSGLYARPASRSKSAVFRTLHEAYYSFVRVCQNDFVRYTAEWKKTIQKLYEENGHSKDWGGEWDFFKMFFETNSDGTLDKRFLLKPRGSMRTITENKVLDLFYDAINKFKYQNNENKINGAIENGTYREVPLVRSSLNERISGGNVLKELVEKAKEDWTVFRDLFLNVDVTLSENQIRELDNLDVPNIPAYILNTDDFREDKLNNHIDHYTTDLDFIFNLIVQQGIRHEYSPAIMMTASAIRAALSYEHWLGAPNTDNIREAVDKFIKNKILSRPITDPKLNNVKLTVSKLKQLVSIAALGVNVKSFTRETITGLYRGIERAGISPQMQSKFSLSDYKAAVSEVITHCFDNTDVMSWHMQLNAIYGTSNFSYDQIAENQTVNQWGIKNLTASDLFFTATWPDFIHRNSIIIAHLKHIKAYDAYKMIDGVLKYDMDLDPRFEILRKYKTREQCPVGLINEWNRVYEYYMDSFNSWKLNGYKNQDGSEFEIVNGILPKLPQALSPREVMGLKDMADAMYGNYDTETKSLMTQMLLGSLFLQFRTYGINRLQEFFDGETDTSDLTRVQQKIKNSKGEKEDAYLWFNKNNSALGGNGPFVEVKPKSEVPLEAIQQGIAVPYTRVESFHINGGLIKQFIDLGVSLWVFDNQEEFNKMWNENPVYRANVKIFMLDTLGMLLLAALINWMYGEAMEGDYDEIDWFTKWSYNVMIGVTQDGPVWSVLSSVVGDGTPPLVSSLQNWSNSAMSIITGKKNFLYGLASTFGATRELAYLFNNVI